MLADFIANTHVCTHSSALDTDVKPCFSQQVVQTTNSATIFWSCMVVYQGPHGPLLLLMQY